MDLPELIGGFIVMIFGAVVIWGVSSALLNPPLPILLTILFAMLAFLALLKIVKEG